MANIIDFAEAVAKRGAKVTNKVIQETADESIEKIIKSAVSDSESKLSGRINPRNSKKPYHLPKGDRIDVINPAVTSTLERGINVRNRTSVSPRPANTRLSNPVLETKNVTSSKYMQNEVLKKTNFPKDTVDHQIDKIKATGFESKGGNFIPSQVASKHSYKNDILDTERTAVSRTFSSGMNFKQRTGPKPESKIFNQKNLKTAVGVGVSGAIVLNMFNGGGQQSNSELYGQKQGY